MYFQLTDSQSVETIRNELPLTSPKMETQQ